MIRFLLDEHVPHAIARGLRNRNVEAATTADTGLLTTDDSFIAQYALENGYVIFTQDDDFLRIHSNGREHAGIVYSKQGSHSIGEVVRHLELMSQCSPPKTSRAKSSTSSRRA